ncbi:MAG: aldehyde dehydrogenase family protein [Gammaproteobacteria bacterium]
MNTLQHYINGQWVASALQGPRFEVVNPANEQVVALIDMGGEAEANAAVAAAKAAFPAYAATSLAERIGHVQRLLAVFERRYDEMVAAITTEMGAPHDLSRNSQAECGPGHLKATLAAAERMAWEQRSGSAGELVHEPVGVCVLITPWNWPMNQVAAKVAPALLAGCTVVLKPSEQSPLSAQLFAEFVHEAALPKGVFNLVFGTGPVVGNVLSAHPDVDMVSFTGSTRAGVQVAKNAADTVKRVHQELGGKSPNIIFADADLEAAVKRGVWHCFNNTGQSCNAPTRMLVEESVYARAVELAVAAGAKVKVGDPALPGPHIGPLASRMQFDKVQACIQRGIDEGARLVLGGLGRPEGFSQGFYVKPTIFADVNNQMFIAREEIFGPVLVMIPFRTVDEAVDIANDTPYGLAAYVQTQDRDKAVAVARRLRVGMVSLNGRGQDYESPFGGYKQSGNGREWGEWGLHDFLEVKVINGFHA